MIKWISLLLLLLPSIAWGGFYVDNVPDPATVDGVTEPASVDGVTSDYGAPSYVHINGLETQADDDDWTTGGGTPNYDYSTAGLSMEGSECIELNVGGETTSIQVTQRAETWVAFVYRQTASFSADRIFTAVRDTGDNPMCYIQVMANENVRVQANGGDWSSQITDAVDPVNTTYYFKQRFKQGTGSNAQCEVWVSTDGTTWGSSVSSTNGDTTNLMDEFGVIINDPADIYIDYFIENDSDITDSTW